MVASILHYLVISSFVTLGKSGFRTGQDSIQNKVRTRQGNRDPISDKLYEPELWKKAITQEFVDDMKRLLLNWSEEMVKIAERTALYKK